jgi:hypothetical protein
MTCTSTSDAARYEDSTYLLTNSYPGVRHGLNEKRQLELDIVGLLDPFRREKRQHKKSKKELRHEDVAI